MWRTLSDEQRGHSVVITWYLQQLLLLFFSISHTSFILYKYLLVRTTDLTSEVDSEPSTTNISHWNGYLARSVACADVPALLN